MKKWNFDTIALHGAFEGVKPNTVVVPIYQSVAYPFDDVQQGADAYAAAKEGLFCYARWDNPTTDIFEKRIAQMEGGEAALATSSGMAAIHLIAHHYCSAGDDIVSSNRVYGGTFVLFDTGLAKMGVKVNWITDPNDLDAWEKAITDKTKFLYVESPSNPSLSVADIPALAQLAHSRNLPLIVDGTICTPALQQPFELGADVVVHSVTKYLSGNATSLSGVIVGSEQLIHDLRKAPMRYLGPSISPFNAWLILMSMETLSLRMEKHSANALALAKYLEGHDKVASVNYPGLESHPHHELAMRQMKGCSSLLSFILKGGYEDAVKIINSLGLWVHATHLGTSKTIVTHPASTTHVSLGEEELKKAGIPANLIRVSVGLEDEEDIIADIEQALAKI
ncbi:MAG: O-acetylhomoserine aminocarboxypropyltransferase/cysteine synthase family protein [Planctomycetota bacterium]|jgi:O-acetylhomoserine/O-acetylserine sulfhydrylase-like pyridoxal-dependent enzyme